LRRLRAQGDASVGGCEHAVLELCRAPDRPGLGFTLRADALERFRYVDGPEYKF